MFMLHFMGVVDGDVECGGEGMVGGRDGGWEMKDSDIEGLFERVSWRVRAGRGAMV